jgi:receptor expression-enhancing protein 5/6
MAGYYHDFMTKLDQLLHEKNRVTDLIGKLEAQTGVKRLYMAQVFIAFMSLYMILGHFAALICNGVGFIYPAYASIRALESKNKDDDTQWLTYWVVFAFFSVAEFFSDIIFSWFPFYWLAKIVFLVWCMLPLASNGTTLVYTRVIRPVFMQNQTKIDGAVNTAMDKMSGFAEKVLDGNKAD